MKFFARLVLVTGLFKAIFISSVAQTDNPYHLNGNAYQENCNCYTLTPDAYNMSGSLWNKNKIDLTQPFDYKFNVFLGCNDGGADGIVFVLQPISTSIGSLGGGLGYEGVLPSVGVALDTWQNAENADPAYDHITIHKNGIIHHGMQADLTTSETIIEGKDNAEDCKWHVLRVIWDPANFLLKAQIDGIDRVQVNIDLVKDIFFNNSMVFWGFTGSTGGAKNHQRVCTSLNAGFTLPPDQKTCFPEPITFIDSSTSFGSIDKWFWDFGDGTTDNSQNPAPHVFPTAGEYDVSLKILGNNGCLSEAFTKKIIAGSKPEALVNVDPEITCDNRPIEIRDSSRVQYGTINHWNWRIDGQPYSEQHPGTFDSLGLVAIPVSLSVATVEGCVSDTVQNGIVVRPAPVVDFDVEDVCVTRPAHFRANNSNTLAKVAKWNWDAGDGFSFSVTTSDYKYRYKSGGTYTVKLVATAENGCTSLPVSKELNIFETRAFAGNDTLVANSQPVQLNASGGVTYRWSPSTGLDNPNIPNPIAVLDFDMSYVLTASSPQGCDTRDTLNIKVYKGPEVFVPNAFSPNGDGKNDQLRFVAAGMKSIDFFEVFNRYGQRVFRTNRHNQGWDGTINGHEQGTGTYVWVIKAIDYRGVQYVKKGVTTLIR